MSPYNMSLKTGEALAFSHHHHHHNITPEAIKLTQLIVLMSLQDDALSQHHTHHYHILMQETDLFIFKSDSTRALYWKFIPDSKSL